MNHRVVYTEQFIDNLREHVGYLRRQHVSDRVIERWYQRLFEHLDTLTTWPRSYAVDVRYTAATGRETRKVNFGDYLVFYEVDDIQRTVRLLAFYHGAARR
jgi:mRNA-degrading endonuclease RelE of RelBE toxin-antitoxin system